MIDLIDKKILYEINWNCRISHSLLAKKLRISKQVVRYRISRLEKKGIIESYRTLIDWRKLGYNSTRVYLKWRNITPEVEEEIYQDIKKDPFFMWTAKFEGEFDIGFYLWVKSVEDFSKKWFRFLEKFRKYILKQEIYESVSMIHYPMKPLATKKHIDEKIIGIGEASNYDVIDYEILKHITKKANTPLIDLARKINLTPKAILYRLRKLEKNKIIIGYNAIIDVSKIDYVFYKIDFYLNSLSKIKEMFEYSKIHKNILYRMRTVGGPDFEIEVMVKDNNELKKLINEIRNTFPKTIEHYRIHTFSNLKQVYLPGEKID